MVKFKVGDRVECIVGYCHIKRGDKGTVLEESCFPYIKFEKYHAHNHSAGGLCEKGYGYSIEQDNLKKVENEMFKVGDIIKGIKGNGYGITNEDMYEGKVIGCLDSGLMWVHVLSHKNRNVIKDKYVAQNSPSKFSLVHKSNKSIHITVKDNTIHAVYKDGDAIIKRSEAKCHPDDEFDFEIGAKLAFNRLMNDGGEMGMKASEVMVFSKFRFIEIYGVEEYKPNAIWVDKWHGKTEREMLDNGYRTLPEWFVPEGEVSPS